MAERDELQKRYAYHAMSNKVERSRGDRSNRIPTGEVESLRGRRNVGRMGDKVDTTSSSQTSEILQRAQKKLKMDKKNESKDGSTTTTTANKSNIFTPNQNILDVDVSSYQPTTPSAKIAYERLLTLLSSNKFIGSNQNAAVLRDAAEVIIGTLKDETLKDPQRQAFIAKTFGTKVSTAEYSQFVQLAKSLDDYGIDVADQKDDDDDAAMNEEGVAVVFDDSEEENDDDADQEGIGTTVVDSESSDDEDGSDDDEEEGPAPMMQDDDDDHATLGRKDTKKTKTAFDKNNGRSLTVQEIDAHFIQRQISSHFKEADEAAELANQILEVLKPGIDLRECENKLLVLLGFDLFDTIKLFLLNRLVVWGTVSMKRATTEEEKQEVERILTQDGDEGSRALEEMRSTSKVEDWSRERMRGLKENLESNRAITNDDPAGGAAPADTAASSKPNQLDLDSLAFRDGAHTMSNKKVTLPDKSWRAMKKGYEEVHVPAVCSVMPSDEELIPVSSLPAWTRPAFKGVEKLNRIQSKMCDTALKSSDNLLLCAPTGAGKTNVAMLTILNILGRYRTTTKKGGNDMDDSDDDEDNKAAGSFMLDKFKIIYVAPMKALVSEVKKNLGHRLKPYGVAVEELSGDSSLTRQQIAETQVIVTTPEKFDIVSRQGEGRAYTQLVRLVIIDEIHLLHDERGPVLEAIVARLIRQVEASAEPIRLVGLSATLPNYADVATFLRVKPDKGLFFFDHSYRPVPLQMQYIGVSERNAFKRLQIQNEVCYEKALTQRRRDKQMLIFVHSRADTAKTAKALRDLAMERDDLSSFVRDGGATQEILKEESSSAKNSELKDLLQFGFAIHHAGMVREDRELVEDLFADRHIAVLCTTSTLAWGVNLPCSTVIIKGTQVYDPSKGRWTEISPLDVQQMLGRAGRPQYDKEGEGIILTRHTELQYYLSLTNLQLPVESQMIKTLPNQLNAEIVLGTIENIEEAVDWLSYTFLYVRMLRNPALYGIADGENVLKTDSTLYQRRLDLAHTAASMLDGCGLVQYDRRSGSLRSTALGRIASQYYITHTSMEVYNRYMRPNMTDIDLLRLFTKSGEFGHVTVREEEKLELAKMAGKVPIPVKESPSEPSAKINILLQAYISRLKLEGFALVADMAFVQQSAARIMRALFEIAVKRGWSGVSKLTLAFANMVASRIWRSQTPLRQFPSVPEVVARKLERKSDIEWSRFVDLSPSDLGELVGVPRMGGILHQMVAKYPRLDVTAVIQPITRSLLRAELTLAPAFQIDIDIHGYSQLFHIFVEDVNGENILHHQAFTLKSNAADQEHVVVMTIPIVDPLPPAYFVRVLADRWLHSEAMLPVSFSKTILPSKFPPPTELLDLQPLPSSTSTLGSPSFVKLFPFAEFNPIQTQTFHELYKTDHNILVCAPSGSGKTTLADFAFLRLFQSDAEGKGVYVAPFDEIATLAYQDVCQRYRGILDPKQIVRLTGEATVDLGLISRAKLVFASAKQWDVLSRRWRQRKTLHSVSLLIFDDLHLLGGEYGPTLEVVISRMRQFGSDSGGKSLRLVGLGGSMANAREIGEWMGVPHKSLFNFSPRARPNPLEIYFQSFEQSNYSARLMAMSKPVYTAVSRHSDGKSVMIFVPSRKQAQLTAVDIMTYQETREGESFVGDSISPEELETRCSQIRDASLKQVALSGIGFLYGGMRESDWSLVTQLFDDGSIKVLVCPADICWKIQSRCFLVVVMGTEYYDGRERRHVDYAVGSLLRMVGRASSYADRRGAKAVLMCHTPKKEYIKKLLNDPLPIESHLDQYLHDHFNSEIVVRTINSLQDAVDYITWSFLYRRLGMNPNYYGLQGTSNIHISEHLSDMVETVLSDLSETKCCQLDDEGNVSPLNLGMIAAYYYIQYTTVELIASSVTEKTKIRGVMEILANASEFSVIPVRYGEEKTLRIEARTLKYKLPDSMEFHEWSTKTLVLLQAHCSRKTLSSALITDQGTILKRSMTLVQAIVDVISSNGWLKPALAAMELSQMLVQGLWNRDSPLLQIPHFTDAIVTRCSAYKGEEPVESVFDILNIPDDVRNDLLRLPDEKMADVAQFCNNYPNIDVSFTVQDAEELVVGEAVTITIELEREVDEDITEEEISELGTVASRYFPAEKREAWWIVIGDTSNNSLLSLKRVSLKEKLKMKLEFVAPDEPGDHELTLFCMSDSYLGADQEYTVNVSLSPDDDDDDSDDSDE